MSHKKTKYLMTVCCHEEWMPLTSPSQKSSNKPVGILRLLPDLSKSFSTAIQLCGGKAEVTRRLKSQESRVNDNNCMLALYDLGNHVFEVRSEYVPRNPEACVECSNKCNL